MNKKLYTIDLINNPITINDATKGIVEYFYDELICKFAQYRNETIHFVLGGDGTLLEILKKYDFTGLYIIIKENGTVGFYSEFITLNDLKNISFNDVIEEEFYPLLVEVDDKKLLAANEILLVNNAKIVDFSLMINDGFNQEYRSSGLIYSSALGSTGLSLSMGGPIVLNNKSSLLKIIAPTRYDKEINKACSFVLGLEDEISIKIKSGQLSLVIDGVVIEDIDKGVIKLKSLKTSYKLLHFNAKYLNNRINRL